MGFLARVFASAFVRRIGYAVAALVMAAVLSMLGIRNASAHESPAGCSNQSQSKCDQGVAYKEANTLQIQTDHCIAAYSSNGGVWTASNAVVTKPGNWYRTVFNCNRNGSLWVQASETYYYIKTCADRPDTLSGYIKSSAVGPAVKACKDGCSYTLPGNAGYTQYKLPDGSGWIKSGAGYTPDGTVCATTVLPAEQDDCIPIDGQSVCKRDDGKLCYSATTGRRICWNSGEVGTKTDGTTAQTRALGTAPIPPNLDQPTAPASTPPITTNVENKTGTTTTNNNYTTNNYTTTSGAPAGDSNQGEGTNPDGTGTGTGGTGTGTGGTGDGTGTDMTETNSLLGQIKDLILGNGTPTTDAQFEADVAAAFGHEDDAPPDDEPADPLAGAKEVRSASAIVGNLDNTGFLGAGSCPTVDAVTVGTTTIPLDLGPLCQILSTISGLVLAVAYLIAFRIIAS